jgi:ribosome-associated protein
MTEKKAPPSEPYHLLNNIAQTIFDKKGFNILAIDVRDISTLTDFFLIAEGSVDRHVRALSSVLREELGEKGHPALHVEGEDSGDWIVMDFGDVLVHLFIPELRERYALENLWKEGKIVDLSIKVADGKKK